MADLVSHHHLSSINFSLNRFFCVRLSLILMTVGMNDIWAKGCKVAL